MTRALICDSVSFDSVVLQEVPRHESVFFNPPIFSRILSSPLLLVCLLVAASFLATALYNADAETRAPRIASYDWSQHRDVLLIVYPLAGSCSTCNLSVAGWTEKGFAYSLDVLIVAAQPNSELRELRNALPHKSLSIITNAEPALIKRFSSGDKIGGVRIRNGRILGQQPGGSPSEQFLAQKEVKT